MFSIERCLSYYINILYKEKLVSFIWRVLPSNREKNEIIFTFCLLLYFPSVNKIYEGLKQKQSAYGRILFDKT